MDTELLVALLVLWCSTTAALVCFFRMFFAKRGEAFHPHSVDVEHRHDVFLAVNSRTVCKFDCPIKSISTFVAPRGSSSSKQFTLLSCMIAVAGFLGTSRWYALGGVKPICAGLCFAGFASLLLVAAFELDVVPERYLEDKLVVTGWLLEKIQKKFDIKVPFPTTDVYCKQFREFIRSSKDIYHLYEEDTYLVHHCKKNHIWNYDSFWSILHMLGACAYVSLLPAAVLLHDDSELKVVAITSVMFIFFCIVSYLSGNFFPVITPLRGIVLLWNPFLREPHYMIKLKRALEAYVAEHSKRTRSPSPVKTKANGKKARRSVVSSSPSSLPSHRSDSSVSSCVELTVTSIHEEPEEDKHDDLDDSSMVFRNISGSRNSPRYTNEFLAESKRVDAVLLDNAFLRFARKHPRGYIRILGHIAVMSELIAMMTPSVALGLQWVTALCEGPSILAVIDLLAMVFTCMRSGDCSFTPDRFQHCILKS